MTFRVGNGSRPPYSAMHDVMVGLRLPTTLFRWRDSLYVLFCVVLRVRMLIEGIATFGSGCREFGHTVLVWRGVSKHVAMSNWWRGDGAILSAVLCYVLCGYHCFVGSKVYNGAFLFWPTINIGV